MAEELVAREVIPGYLAMIALFMVICLVAIAWIFRTGYKIRT